MIKLAKLTDYAVATLAVMVQNDGALLSAAQLAEKASLPEPTVSKILKLLANAQIVASVRGAYGGYKLEQSPDVITVLDIIEAIEGRIALTACIDGQNECCTIDHVCHMRGRWDSVNSAVKTALENVTLRDMTPMHSDTQPQTTQSRIMGGGRL